LVGWVGGSDDGLGGGEGGLGLDALGDLGFSGFFAFS